jgi:chemotaxis protein MotB
MKRRSERTASHERWLVSYADFITLLFAFFVVLYSSSQVDKAKMARLAAAIEGAFQGSSSLRGKVLRPEVGRFEAGASAAGAAGMTPVTIALPKNVYHPQTDEEAFLALKRQLETLFADELKAQSVVLRPGLEGLVISLSELGFFDSASAELLPEARAQFGRIATLLVAQDVDIRIEGHTDNVPIHTAQFASNWDLSTARAVALTKLMITEYKCSPERLSVAGYGEYHPVASNATAAGRKQNRRVDLVVLLPRRAAPVQPPTEPETNRNIRSGAAPETSPHGRLSAHSGEKFETASTLPGGYGDTQIEGRTEKQ